MRRVPSPRGNYDNTLSAIVDLVAQTSSATPVRAALGVGIPGTISPASGLVKNANSTWLNGRPLVDDCRGCWIDRRFANDPIASRCPRRSTAPLPVHPVFGVILGTGTGGGIVLNGSVLQARTAVGGVGTQPDAGAA